MSSQSEWSQIPPELQSQIIKRPKDYVPPSISSMFGDKVTIRPTTSTETPRAYIYQAGPALYSFAEMRAQIAYALLRAPSFNRGAWQTLNVSQSVQHDTRELRNVVVLYDIPQTIPELTDDVSPDMPWADEHFGERVGRRPLNPAPSYRRWPHHNGSAERHVDGAVFSHTYPERFWPKQANPDEIMWFPNGRRAWVNTGLRYAYGDLDDVVGQLAANPLTRQAVLPVWFPEDTGAIDRRVPCSLSYHFQNSGDGRLDCWYSMRACDFTRHFHNDVYLAARLVQWVCAQLATRDHDDNIITEGSVTPGTLNLTISNLHLFEGDVDKVTG